MSTATLAEAAAPAVDFSVAARAGRRLGNLLAAFWYRTRNVAAPVFKVTVGLAQTVAMPVLVLAAPPVGALAIAATQTTSSGRRAA